MGSKRIRRSLLPRLQRVILPVCTGTMMSMTGFAGSSGTAVLPMCSIDSASQGARTAFNSKRSDSILDSHESS